MTAKGRVAVRIDNKGRISLPKEVRKALDVETGDTVFLRYDSEGRIVRMLRAVEDPIAVLWEQAEREFEEGKTKNLRDYAKERGI